MSMLLLDPRNSNQLTTQGGWRYTPCGYKTCSRTYTGSADTCPIPTSSGIERTPRMRSSPMLMPRKFDHYARLGEDRQTSTDRHRVHRPLPTIAGQCFVVDAFASGHTSHRGYKYCDVMRDGASQMIYCNFTKSRGAEDIVKAITKLWDLNPDWKVFDHCQTDHLNPRFIRMDSETS